eukprot:CAMPEP_0172384076 /NCGR_PEP_ID=MMETSP1061-20121228/1867_1 /TAXON_ID=37318 /ORGANISM="Pseudo-nitzschia pungens, Strain cf. pungens" /LENGTH=518 /DNA_ID=CAMNT_0013112563 /DNA_START=160 /DNA_END=1716 /DNA_ORIENTATION=+
MPSSTDHLPSSMSSLLGKVAVVTGSTQGLGEATLRLFRDRGCRGLVVTGRNEQHGRRLAKELTSATCTAIFVRADLACIDDCRNLMKVTDEAFGTLDILVNAAATTDRGSLWDTTPEDYDRIMNVNTRAPFFLMQDAARIMEREGVEGSIINVSSTASYGSMPMLAAYGMSKGALNIATKNAAYSLAWSRIRVNALAIGWMDTPGEDTIQRKLHCSPGENWKQKGEDSQPFGRLLKTEEVARCIAFCASAESGMMTGCVIDFDQSIWGAGNAPVPPPKDQWARAKGMTFSFPKTDKPSVGVGVSVSVSASAKSSGSPSRSSSPFRSLPGETTAARRTGSRSPGRLRVPSVPKEEPKPAVSTVAATETPKPVSPPRTEVPASEPTTTTTTTTTTTSTTATTAKEAEPSPDTDDSDKDDSNSNKSTPPASPKSTSPDNDDGIIRPDPEPFKAAIRQREGQTWRPDEYLPGTEPPGFVPTYRRTKSKKKVVGDPAYQGMSRVDDWLGSGVKPKRTWRVKEK